MTRLPVSEYCSCCSAGQPDNQTSRQAHRQIDRQIDLWIDKQLNIYIYTQIDRYIDRWMPMLLARAEIRKKFGSISFWGSQVSQSIPVPCFALLKILARIGWSEIDSKPLYLGIKTIVVFCICLPQSIETQGRTSFTQETTRLGRRTARWTLRFFQSCSADIFPAR